LTVKDSKSPHTKETDCEVTVDDGSWMTCDMITDEDEAAAEEGDKDAPAGNGGPPS
jgi:hypothetical protein